MKAIKLFFAVMMMLAIYLAGCAKAEEPREGFVLEVKDESILVAQNITMERYNELKDVSSEALIDQGGLDLIWLTYEKAADFKKGDQVQFWLDGDVRESYPAQADARKIEHK
ncbi:DUF3221 domain-containing protein [Mesobacillus jeotgali]|uniref:DUF3221 domain-containing protein n=1 Tax=Mesobacillus jeotgali TaxID=129985 RepID=A0ABY9VHC6_9BACI|nr:DUF3221 domain-containing protein [Mesobacillus jeotgali]WNF23293.1 DUF3221 domain-containing protein [Mesobacillus jeotgali]